MLTSRDVVAVHTAASIFKRYDIKISFPYRPRFLGGQWVIFDDETNKIVSKVGNKQAMKDRLAEIIDVLEASDLDRHFSTD